MVPIGMNEGDGRSPLRGSGQSSKTEPVPVSAQSVTVPNALEFRPRENGDFDEIVARFANGMVHVETLSDQGCYVGFYWDDGRYCQWWIGCTGRGKLTYTHEDGVYESPTAQGMSAGTAETQSGSGLQPASPVGEADAPKGQGQ